VLAGAFVQLPAFGFLNFGALKSGGCFSRLSLASLPDFQLLRYPDHKFVRAGPDNDTGSFLNPV